MEKLYYVSLNDCNGSAINKKFVGGIVYTLAKTEEIAIGKTLKNISHDMTRGMIMGEIEVGEVILFDDEVEKNIRKAVDSLFGKSNYYFYGITFLNSENSSSISDEYKIIVSNTVAQSEEEALGRLILHCPDPIMKNPSDIGLTLSTLHKVSLIDKINLGQKERSLLVKEMQRYWLPEKNKNA